MASFSNPSGGGGYTYVQDAEPSTADAEVGETWLDTGNNLEYVFDGGAWVETSINDHSKLTNVQSSQHHTKTTDSSDLSDVSPDSNSNAHHPRYSDNEARSAVDGSGVSLNHDNLSGVSPSDHHSKTTSASELSDVSPDSTSNAHHSRYSDGEARNAVDGSNVSVGNADTVDGKNASELYRAWPITVATGVTSTTYNFPSNNYNAVKVIGHVLLDDAVDSGLSLRLNGLTDYYEYITVFQHQEDRDDRFANIVNSEYSDYHQHLEFNLVTGNGFGIKNLSAQTAGSLKGTDMLSVGYKGNNDSVINSMEFISDNTITEFNIDIFAR